MFAAGKPVWYLPLAVLLTAALSFALVLGYERSIFARSRASYPEKLTTFLSVDTINALKEDARLHHALLGLTESLAHTSSSVGQQFGIGTMKEFGETLANSVSELRKRHDVADRKRGLLDDAGEAIGNLLGGLGMNTTGGLSSVVGNLGSALTQGLATPALFLGIGVGYVCRS